MKTPLRLRRPGKKHRRGNIIVLSAVLMIVMVAFLALGVDIGYLQNARVELQRSADAAAMAGAWELIDEGALQGAPGNSDDILAARNVAAAFAASNKICSTAPVLDTNLSNVSSGDVVAGYLADPSDPGAQLVTTNPTKFNALQVRVRRTSAQNGEVPLFFARVLGFDSFATEATATAALIQNVSGFRAPSGNETLGILPFALDKQTWDALKAGGGSDNWQWDSSTKSVLNYGDGIKEVNLYPQGTGSPGNRGTVDIGGSNNSTNDIARQIVHGISAGDMEDLDKPLEFNEQGKLYLNGDTGISAGVKDDLASIIGQTRVIPIFEQVVGPGNNATYTIVEWAGVRILEVNLTGKMSSKRLIVQPAAVLMRSAIPNPGAQTSSFVYSPAWLVR